MSQSRSATASNVLCACCVSSLQNFIVIGSCLESSVNLSSHKLVLVSTGEVCAPRKPRCYLVLTTLEGVKTRLSTELLYLLGSRVKCGIYNRHE